MPKRGKGQKRKLKAVIQNSDDKEIVFNLPSVSAPPAAAGGKAKKPKLDLQEDNEGLPRRSPNGYILPDPLPSGLIVTDLNKKQWKIGKSIGLGGFGEIYSAASLNGKRASPENFVVKVEPHTNGPLFVELHFYCRATKLQDINEYKASKNLTHLGIPDLKGHGSFDFNRKKLRFIVLPRYGTDLQTMLDQSKCHLSIESACSIATQIIDCYEYLHSKGYVHKDLKGSNLIFSRAKKSLEQKIFLVDYGLTSRLHHLGLHKPFEPDQRSAHEGTLEYTSRDSHLGCVSRRSDIEVLLYVLIDLMGGKLPWDQEPGLKPGLIQNMKIEAFHDIGGFLQKAFHGGKDKIPPFLTDLMTSVKKMKFEEVPDYNFLKSLFKPFLLMNNNGNKNQELMDEDGDQEISMSIELGCKQQIFRKPSKRRSLPLSLKRQQSVSQPWTHVQLQAYLDQKNEVIQKMSEESLLNPTPAMTEQLARMMKRSQGVLPIQNAPRRKGLTAKRRLLRNPASHDNDGDKNVVIPSPLPFVSLERLSPITLRKDTLRAASGSLAVRKSPRKAQDKKARGIGGDDTSPSSLGQHLYGIVAPHLGAVSNLVKSMFQTSSNNKATKH